MLARQADFLFRFAQRRVDGRCIVVFRAAAGKADLAGMAVR
jgi:hypothetical protein